MAASPIGTPSPLHSLASSSTDIQAKTTQTTADAKVSTTFADKISHLSSSSQAQPPSFKMATELKENIQNVANRINDQGIRLLGEKIGSKELASKVINLLRNVDGFVKSAQFNESFLKVEIQGAEKVEHVYISYNKNDDTIQLIFDKNKSTDFSPGKFKSLHQGVSIGRNQDEDVKPLILTKELQHIEGEQSSGVREERALILCRDNRIPGTPSFHFIKNYTGKIEENGELKSIPKQAILMDFLPGGDLDKNKPRLSNENKLSIAKQISETISELHRLGISYNDLKDENIVLDKNGNPVLIDYGAATIEGEKERFGMKLRFTGTLYTFPPEMFKPKERENMIIKIGKFLDAKDALTRIEKDYNDLYSQFEDVDNKSDEINLDADERRQLIQQGEDLLTRMNNLENNIFKEAQKKYNDLIDEIQKDGNKNKLPNGWIPQKNDDYALGVVLKGLFGDALSGDVNVIIDGLLNPDPAQRMSSREAFQRFQAIT